MRILFLTTLLPFPLDNGGKIKTYYLLKALSNKNMVDVLTFINNKKDNNYIKQIEQICNQVEVVEKILIAKSSKKQLIKDYLKSFFSRNPYVINKFYSKNMAYKLIEYQKKNSYDLIYVDHLPMMVYHRLFRSPVILDEHNVESLIMKRRYEAEKNTIKKYIEFLEYKKLVNFEKKSLIEANHIISLSEQDKQELSKLINNKKKIDVLPICIEKNYVKKSVERKQCEKLRLLFVGTMSWYPNSQGIEWFIKEVFTKLDENKFELFVVGGNPPTTIKRWNRNDNIHIVGYVEDVNDYIESCHVNIVPIFIGSGLRVKIIEAFSKGIPVLSTSIGAEGIKTKNGVNILIADNSKEFIDHLNKIYDDDSILNNIKSEALATFEKHYSLNYLTKRIDNIILL